ncbi:MAG: hypothetical protein A4C66_14835 [Nitrospira sp. HN-bin3]|uniref:hypothetical protein n=1 Tax=Nitrospira cf. moscoviensis SBR1015 TaxID=96242 RepID=UPI000A0CD2A1|nr:hypothetical protein [Nitrospira cf. moscoviensis SBR1015]MBH0208286.1 hypothetical protein [Nitrospira sp.]OQW47408.1 MAG: hypothetical protein A4C66_14835 [Nitrospira sp. HN-bin3]
MIRNQSRQGWVALLVSTSLFLAGCTTALVQDDVRYPKTGAHCSGSQGVDDSSIAVLPVPVVAFVVPHANLHDIKADDYLKRCGDSTKLINRKVEVNRTACIPAGLTRIITLGIWQWCPASISWEADVKS